MDDSDRDPLIASVARELRRPATDRGVGGPDFTSRLMAEVEREPVPGTWDERPPRPRASVPGRALRWMALPRTVRVSPLIGLAAAAGIAALAVLVAPEKVREVPARDVGELRGRLVAGSREPSAGSDAIEFVLHAPEARSVAVAGDFNDWNPAVHPLARREGGLWVARVPLPVGRYEYTFVVDGSTWTPDPAAPPAPGGDFGTTNSVLVVGEVR